MKSLAKGVDFPPHHSPPARGVNRPTYFAESAGSILIAEAAPLLVSLYVREGGYR
jgi:hypothetical protein